MPKSSKPQSHLGGESVMADHVFAFFGAWFSITAGVSFCSSWFRTSGDVLFSVSKIVWGWFVAVEICSDAIVCLALPGGMKRRLLMILEKITPGELARAVPISHFLLIGCDARGPLYFIIVRSFVRWLVLSNKTSWSSPRGRPISHCFRLGLWLADVGLSLGNGVIWLAEGTCMGARHVAGGLGLNTWWFARAQRQWSKTSPANMTAFEAWVTVTSQIISAPSLKQRFWQMRILPAANAFRLTGGPQN